jgi:hypothetical protein
MKQEIVGVYGKDAGGNPWGGCTRGLGIEINWQAGPLGRGKKRKKPNGAFVEGVIAAAIDRLTFFQLSKFNCVHNKLAIKSLEKALFWLDQRTTVREQRKTEGTHQV